MIEYGLLFGLGFLTALLAVLLLAPVVHRRIVKFTEDRIMATTPVSPQELRAQKDMVRAEMAAAIARTGHDLKIEREKASKAGIARDEMAAEAARLHGENAELAQSIEDMKIEAAELRAELRNEELTVAKLRETISQADHDSKLKDARVEELLHRAYRLGVEIDNLKIELAGRDTEIEGLKVRVNGLRDERETLRDDLKAMTSRAKEAELHLAREENRARRLEDKLNEEVSGSIDKDAVLERRMSEISKLREKLKTGEVEPREAAPNNKAKPFIEKAVLIDKTRRKPRDAGAESLLALAPTVDAAPAPTKRAAARVIDDQAAEGLSESIRAQSSDTAEALLTLDPSRDDAMRDEIADLAARMIAVVGHGEGASSPVRAMISGKPVAGVNGRVSLANRAQKLLYPES